ncbi:unnamed protein product [Cladocopium goreaui]|uniref:Uncharacterized protein n=1 Tax=Cladocopium goreaui TaxID=2562237 RepID=A0A9P1M652_9DINO|nr:unnamed protein product [Cladocopium goreaui]
MPPKKKQKTTKALPAPCEDEDQSEPDLGPSKAHWIKVHDALARIFSHELFKDILTADPLSVKDGGREAALDATQAASALKNAGVYKCAANFFHQDFLFMATHKVPMNEAQVQQIKDYWFPKNEPPSLCPFVITVALETPGCIGQRPQNGFQRLSPPEPVHALLFALAEAIESKAKVGVLRAFRSCILTATFVFEICPVGEDRYWRAQNIREEMVEKGLSVQLSLCQAVLEWCDQNWLTSSAWKSIYALQALLDRGGTPEMIAWSLEGMVDGVRMSFLDGGHFVISKLKDSRASYIEVLKMKRKTLLHLLNTWLNDLKLEKKWKDNIKSYCGSYEMLRKHISPYPDTQADTAWLLGCPPSVSEICEFLDQLVFGSHYDARYKDAIKSKHEVEDFLNYTTLKTTMETIEKMTRQEDKPEGLNGDEEQKARTEEERQETELEAASASEAAAASEAAPASEEVEDNGLSEADKVMWRQHMRKILNQHVRFVADHRTNVELESVLKETPFMSLRGDQTGMALFHFDLKKYGEPTTRPDLRTPTFRENLYTRLVKSVLAARQDAMGTPNPNLQAGEVALIFDAGKKGLMKKLLSPWKEGTAKTKEEDEEAEDDGEEDAEEEDDKPTFCVDTLMIGYSESSLSARKKRLRGTCTLKQMESCHILSSKRLSLPSRDRKHYAGSTTGDLISNVHMPAWSSEWQLPWKEKKELLGKKHMIAVGGKTQNKEEEKQNSRSSNGLEPVCFHSPPYEHCDELIHDFFAKIIIDLTPLDGRMAWAALRNRVGYVGVAFNPEHQRLLEDRLLALLEKEMTNPESSLFSSAYSEAVGGGSGKDEQEEGEEEKDDNDEEDDDVWDPLGDDDDDNEED